MMKKKILKIKSNNNGYTKNEFDRIKGAILNHRTSIVLFVLYTHEWTRIDGVSSFCINIAERSDAKRTIFLAEHAGTAVINVVLCNKQMNVM